MSEFLQAAFALVCGQNLDHTWAPGGVPLPCCQRCTGLYAGAALAFALHVLFRPKPTPGYLWLHGMFLLQMVPFGFHWLPQGPVLRTMTGLLFGAGLVAYLWLGAGALRLLRLGFPVQTALAEQSSSKVDRALRARLPPRQ